MHTRVIGERVQTKYGWGIVVERLLCYPNQKWLKVKLDVPNPHALFADEYPENATHTVCMENELLT